MKRLLLAAALVVSACVPPITPVTIPQRGAAPFTVGLTFAPFTESEWSHFATWPKPPCWRVEADQWLAVVLREPHQCLHMVAVTEDDHSVIDALRYMDRASFIELGNEPNFGQDAVSVNAWYARQIAYLRAMGYTGTIITAGVGNIDDDTLRWLETSLHGLPPDIVAGVHFYSGWQGQIGKLLAVLKSRPWAMTESGMDQPTAALEQQAVPYVASVCDAVYAAGSLMCAGYQTHSASSGSNANFGIFRVDGSVRPWDTSLRAAVR